MYLPCIFQVLQRIEGAADLFARVAAPRVDAEHVGERERALLLLRWRLLSESAAGGDE